MMPFGLIWRLVLTTGKCNFDGTLFILVQISGFRSDICDYFPVRTRMISGLSAPFSDEL